MNNPIRKNNNVSKVSPNESLGTTLPSPSSSSSSARVSAHQVHSFMLLYPRLASLVLAPIATPVLLPVLFFTVNALTAGHALVIAVVATLLWRAGIGAIYRYSSSAADVEKALALNETRLPLLATVTSAVAVFLTSWIATGDALAWFPSATTVAGWVWQCVCATLLLQASVFLRYFGPVSIMRCSSVPLVSNPFESYVWYFIRYPGSIFEPGEHPEELKKAEIVPEENRGRRHHHPSSAATSMLVILGVVGGWLLFVSGLGSFPDAPNAALTACILIGLCPANDYVRQKNHELDPRPYLSVSKGWAWDMARLAATRAVSTASWILVLAWIVDGVVEQRWWVGSWYALVCLTVFTWFALCMRTGWEECLRMALFHPRPNLLQEILDMTDGSHTACVQIILECLLVDAALAQEVLTARSSRRSPLSTKHVMAQTQAFSKQHGQQLLRKLPLYVEAPLEEDVIRFGILEALGGPANRGIAKEWLNLVLPLVHGGQSPEPPCATLVRGFCVVLGGMGEALQKIVHHASVVKPKEHRLDTWELSTGGLLSLEFTLTALSRWLGATPSSKRTQQQLGLLLPVALTSMYQLHDALDKYRQIYVQGNVGSDFALLQRVLRTCEGSAARLAKPLLEGSKVDPPVELRVWQWLLRAQDLVDESDE